MVFESIEDKFNREFKLSEERKSHILEHPEMKTQFDKIIQTLKDPDFIKCSELDEHVLLFYRFYSKTPVGKSILSW